MLVKKDCRNDIYWSQQNLRRRKPQKLAKAQMKLPSYILRQSFEDALAHIESNKDQYVKRPGIDFTRERKLSFSETMRFICCMYAGTLNRELINYFGTLAPSKAAFIKRRQLISPQAFRDLFDYYNKATSQWDKKTYKGYRLLAFDGSGIRLANNPESRTYQKALPGKKGINYYTLCALYDIKNKVYLDYEIQAIQDSDERKASQHILSRLDKTQKSIVLFDRGYEGYYQMEFLNRQDNTYYLMRIKNNDSKLTRNLPMEELDIHKEIEVLTTQTKADKERIANSDNVVWIAGKSKSGKCKKTVSWHYETPCKVKTRIVRLKLDTGEYETLATSLPDSFTQAEIKHLYHLRWGIETSFRDLKLNLGIEQLHTKDEELVLQEIAARLTLFNYCTRIILNSTKETIQGRKWLYQPAMSDCIFLCREWLFDNEPPPDEEMFSRFKEPIRPGRRDPRNIKLKTFPYFTYRTAA